MVSAKRAHLAEGNGADKARPSEGGAPESTKPIEEVKSHLTAAGHELPENEDEVRRLAQRVRTATLQFSPYERGQQSQLVDVYPCYHGDDDGTLLLFSFIGHACRGRAARPSQLDGRQRRRPVRV
eukprot:3839465-Pyramimonas_sp.AAC.1